MKVRGWRRELSRGARVPAGYGLAWVETPRGIAVCYPWPVNWLARHWRETIWRLLNAARALRGPSREQDELANAHRLFREREVLAEQYASGYLAGWQECFEACTEAIEDELSRAGIVRGRESREPRAARVLVAGKRPKPN